MTSTPESPLMANLRSLPAFVPQRYPPGQVLALTLAFALVLWGGRKFVEQWRATLPLKQAVLML